VDYKLILYDLDEYGIARVTLNNPETMNALSWAMLAELDNAFVTAEKDDDVKLIIIKGAERCFSSGFNLATQAHVGDEPRGKKDEAWRGSLWNCRAHTLCHADYSFRIWDLWKIVISQVHGYCLGGATELASICDLMVISEDCWWGYPITRFNNVGDVQAHNAWHVGLKRAMEIQLGRILTGKEAHEWGLANYCFPADELEEQTTRIARRIAIMDPELLMLHKTLVHRTFDVTGFRTAEYNSAEYDTFGKARRKMRRVPADVQWNEYKRKYGLAKTLKMMHEPFGGLKPGGLNEYNL